MSKLAATALGVVVLGSGATLTGGYFLGWFGYDSELPNELKNTEPDKQNQILGEGCSKSLFPSISNLSATNVADVTSTTGSKVETGFFSSDTGVETEGCLVVNWDKSVPKEEGKKENGKGNIRFLGAVKETKDTGAKGFVVFVLGTTEENSGSQNISGKGIAYKLEQETNKGWKISGRLAATTGKSFSSTTTEENQFPQTGDALGQPTNQNFWGLFESKDKISKVCTSTTCPSGTEMKDSSFRGYWTWTSKNQDAQSDTNKKQLGGGTKEIDKGGKEIFDNSKWDMNAAVTGKQGFGKQKYLTPKPASAAKAQ